MESTSLCSPSLLQRRFDSSREVSSPVYTPPPSQRPPAADKQYFLSPSSCCNSCSGSSECGESSRKPTTEKAQANKETKTITTARRLKAMVSSAYQSLLTLDDRSVVEGLSLPGNHARWIQTTSARSRAASWSLRAGGRTPPPSAHACSFPPQVEYFQLPDLPP